MNMPRCHWLPCRRGRPAALPADGASTPRPSSSGLRTLSAMPRDDQQRTAASDDVHQGAVIASAPHVGDGRAGHQNDGHLGDAEISARTKKMPTAGSPPAS